ncbi:MAG TPA: hypothetical protein VMW66_06085 [Elusimicrobiales bacterium]|nr:hypothetical protein [Elusimicrobiales bacterium]
MKVDIVKLSQVVKQVNDDQKKTEEFQKDPKAYLASHGLEIPEGARIEFLPGTKASVCVSAGVAVGVSVGS